MSGKPTNQDLTLNAASVTRNNRTLAETDRARLIRIAHLSAGLEHSPGLGNQKLWAFLLAKD